MRPKQITTTPVVQPTESPVSTESATPSSATEGAMIKKEGNTVKVTTNGFLPQSLTIKAGDTVTWMNADSENHTVNSDPHPTHTLFPILNKVGLMKAGESKSLQFTQAGTYKYHDHLNSSLTGTITVQ